MSNALPSSPPVGVIVAGGQARRLGGGDKTLRLVGGRPILAALIERLAPQCGVLALNANGDPARFARFALPVVADDPEDGGRGPLAGVLAALDWSAALHPRTPRVLTVPGDLPAPPHDLVARLAAAADDDDAIAAACSGERRHPLTALWPVGARHRLRLALRAAGERRVEGFLAGETVRWVAWPILPVDPFLNVNTPADLAAASAGTGAVPP